MATAAASVSNIKVGGLVEALIAAQKEFKPAIKDSINPHFRSKFVDLAGAHDACNEALWKHGLTVVQTTRVQVEGGAVLAFLVTKLEHVSGESRESEWPLQPAKANDPQALGAALTYARRYCYMAILGIAPEDDDGNTASGRAPAPAPKARPATSAPAPTNGNGAPPSSDRPGMITDKQRGYLKGLVAKLLPRQDGETEEELRARWLEWLCWAVGRDVAGLDDLTIAEAKTAIEKAKAGETPDAE